LNKQNLLALLAAVIKQYGERVSGGAEIFISHETLKNISPTSTVQEIQEPTGFRFRFRNNEVVDAEGLKEVKDGN
jgi:hypothetical protein